MKRLATVVLSLFVLGSMASAQTKAEAKQTYDKKYVLNYMKETRKAFLKSIKVSDAQWNFKAAPEKWSIAETAEHIALSEKMLGDMVRNQVIKSPAATEAQLKEVAGKEAVVTEKIPDRSQKAQAPAELQPKKTFATKAELIKAFETERKANIDFLNKNYDELRKHVGPSPVGLFDGAQWELFLAAHSKRHTAQIEEVKQATGYPKK